MLPSLRHPRKFPVAALGCAVPLLFACSGANDGTASGGGGNASLGGAASFDGGSGGTSSAGGTSENGGNGGARQSGGAPGAGGTVTSGGTSGAGGATETDGGSPGPDSVWSPLSVMAIVNPKDSGAFCDGTHDDLAALEATVDALPSSGGVVYLPKGAVCKKTNVFVM